MKLLRYLTMPPWQFRKRHFLFFAILVLWPQCSIGQAIDSFASKFVVAYQLATGSSKRHFARQIEKLQPSFDSVYSWLAAGRRINPTVRVGFHEINITTKNGLVHPNVVFVPYNYSPNKRWMVEVFLHGGVRNNNPRQIFSRFNPNDTAWQSVSKIVVLPAAWNQSQWIDTSQTENITSLLAYIKRNFNIDQNHVSMVGVSDGAVGIYHFANKLPTSFSAYVPLIGSMEVLWRISPSQYYLQNYAGQSFFVVNCRNDNVFDFELASAYVNALSHVARKVTFFAIDTSGHSLAWYPVLKDTIDSFLNNTARDPFPDTVMFAVDDSRCYNRKFWVEINQIWKCKKVVEKNLIVYGGEYYTAFKRFKSFAQIYVRRSGNRVDVEECGIKKFTLLLSPLEFDFDKPIDVYIAGHLVYSKMVQKDLRALLYYNQLDDDPELMVGASISIKVGAIFNDQQKP
ncbi:MAG TPA: hypothetical protein VMV56_04490 [Williamwhitmania sp.]|nr:hypothetical protein [Williamwhitmania sp.]